MSRWKRTASEKFQLWLITIGAIIVGLIPTWGFIALWALLDPTGFWQKIAIVFVAGGIALALQVWGIIIAISIIISVWE